MDDTRAPNCQPRAYLIVAVVAAALALLPTLAACRPSPTATRAPITRPASRPTPTTTAGFTAVLTPTETATFTPQATLDPSVPAPVSMTLDEAKAEALSWFDASRSPRVEWAGYVAREVIGAGLEDGRIYDTISRVFRPIESLSTVGIVVVASTFGLSMPLDADQGDRNSPCGHGGCGGDETVREAVIVVFDARTGEVYAAMPDVPGAYLPDFTTLHAAPAPSTDLVPRPPPSTPTALWARGTLVMLTPTTFPTPAAVSLRNDNVPANMRNVLEVFPQLPGSRWRWRVTARYDGVRWSAWTLEETVEAGWIVSDDRVVVRSRRSGERVSGVPLGTAVGSAIGTIWRTIHADGVVDSASYLGPLGPPGPNVMTAGCCPGNDIAVLMDPHADPTRTPSLGPNILTAVHRTLTASAGRFDDCATFYMIGGNGWGTHRAVCRGVGYVRAEHVAFTSAGEAIESMDLLDYDVVLPR